MRIVFPDPLIWQSGLEFGLQALGELQRRGLAFDFYLRNQGPMLEAATFAIIQYKLFSRVHWVRRWPPAWHAFDLAIFPRVGLVQPDLLGVLIREGIRVLTSEGSSLGLNESAKRFPRRDWAAVVDLVEGLASNKVSERRW